MLIGNTILGLAKLARLMKLAGVKHSQAAQRAEVSSLEMLAHLAEARASKQATKRKGKFRLNDKENPVPEWLETVMSTALQQYVANSNLQSKESHISHVTKDMAAAHAHSAGESFKDRVKHDHDHGSGNHSFSH